MSLWRCGQSPQREPHPEVVPDGGGDSPLWREHGGAAPTPVLTPGLRPAFPATGEVYTWGDNDEGQLGDGTTNAIQRPRLVAALQGKKVNRVACGSAHTLAWSTSKPASAGKLPAQVSAGGRVGWACVVGLRSCLRAELGAARRSAGNHSGSL